MTGKMVSEIISLVEKAKNVFVSSVDENGYPNTKAMLSLQRDGMGIHYFSTNASSKRAAQFKANPKACIYYCDEPAFHGLMLSGKSRSAPMHIIRSFYGAKALKGTIQRALRTTITASTSLPPKRAGITPVQAKHSI